MSSFMCKIPSMKNHKMEQVKKGTEKTMNDSDDDLLSSAVDGLEEEEDWTDTAWAQPILQGTSWEDRGSKKPSVNHRWGKVSDGTKLDRGGSFHSGTHEVGLQENNAVIETGDVMVSGRMKTESDLQLKRLKESVAVMEPGMVNRMSLNDNKAGMEGLDKEKINQIIHEASKGSKFYENERKKEEQMKRRIDEQKHKVDCITEEQLQQGLNEADKLLEEFESHRDLSHTIVHIDMDAFYAAVEMRDDPSLKDKPMAVGGTAMLSTSNYHARKFGVRAAMPGFIGKKLCPDLIIVPTNFEKYTAVSKQVRSIMSDYDPNFCPMSLDEAYLDITDHLDKRLCMSELKRTYLCRDKAFVDSKVHCLCDLNIGEKKNKLLKVLADNEANIEAGSANLGNCDKCGLQLPPFTKVIFGIDDEEAVKELRTRIEQRTRLTASAGIAPNMMLSKVCSDKNKPNGQYKVPATREAVLEFIKDLPTRKISGIGKVSETMLNALGVFTCTDLYEKRALLYHLYSPISFNYFMRICLGIGSTTVERDSDRKSISTERTFAEISKPAELYKKCEELCESLAEDLKDEQLKGRTVTLKLKTVKFEVKTRAHSLADYTDNKDEILKAATDLLRTEIQTCAPQPLRLRLMGVRMSSLLHQSQCKTKKQNTITGLLKKMAEKTEKDTTSQNLNKPSTELGSALGDADNTMGKDKLHGNEMVNQIKEKSVGSDITMYTVEDNTQLLEMGAEDIAINKQETENELKNHNPTSELATEVAGGSRKSIMDQIDGQESVEKSVEQNDNENPVVCTPGRRTRSGFKDSPKTSNSRKRRNSKKNSQINLSAYVCPVCCRNMLFKDLNQFNEHIDDCIIERDMNSNHFPASDNHIENQDYSSRNKGTPLIEGSSEKCIETVQQSDAENNKSLKNLKMKENRGIEDSVESLEKKSDDSTQKDVNKLHHSFSNEKNRQLCPSSADTNDKDNAQKLESCEIQSAVKYEGLEECTAGPEKKCSSVFETSKDDKEVVDKLNESGSVIKVRDENKQEILQEDLAQIHFHKCDDYTDNGNVCKNLDAVVNSDTEQSTCDVMLPNSASTFDSENQCNFISSTNENDIIDKKRHNDITSVSEPELPYLNPLILDSEHETGHNNKDETDTKCKPLSSLDETEVGSTSERKHTDMSSKLSNAENMERLVEHLIDKTIANDNVKLVDRKVTECIDIFDDTNNSKQGASSYQGIVNDFENPSVSEISNVTVSDLERPNCSFEAKVVRQNEDKDVGTDENHTSQNTVIENHDVDQDDGSLLVCPICNIEQRVTNLTAFNDHVDSCLSRGTISEILKEQRGNTGEKTKPKRSLPAVGQKSAKRRKTDIKIPVCRSITSFFQGK